MSWTGHPTELPNVAARCGLRTLLTLSIVAAAASPLRVHAQDTQTDAREGLRAGYMDAATAIRNMELLASRPRPEGFSDAASLGNILFANTDMAFRGSTLFLGSFHGFQIWDISDPTAPALRTAFVCPGGQGDVSVHGDLLFMSVEMPNGRVDCGVIPPAAQASPERFRGVRIFDVSNLDSPRQIAAVQTCRGSHTHTLVTHPGDAANVYVYVSGTSYVRPAEELEGCSGAPPEQDPNTALFRIEIIQVPLASPQDARIVNAPRIFADAATGSAGGLWRGGSHGEGTQSTAATDQCHDITAYPDLGLAGGACSGNGILLDIRDPVRPVRIDEVIDPNFAYWHSATFNNDGTKVIFTDEWGGGLAARCLATDPPEWGANAIFEIEDGAMRLASYYKLPAAQTETENCVAHNGSLVPVPGRDIMVQAWYQGGISVFDFTDAENPTEIAYFDRGPLGDSLMLGGHWSAYWYNGRIYGSAIARGLDVFDLIPSEHLTRNEIDAAREIRLEQFNPQLQTRTEWPASHAVARAYVDQLRRADGTAAERAATVAAALDRVERTSGAERRGVLAELRALATQIEGEADGAARANARRMRALAETLRGLAAANDR
jgi:hypothetical protein